MNRRQFLAVGGAGVGGFLGGCLSAPTTGQRVVSIEDGSDRYHDGTGVHFELELVSNAWHEDDFPEFAVTVSNNGEMAVYLRGWWEILFEGGPSEPLGLGMISEDEAMAMKNGDAEDISTEGCLTVDSRFSQLGGDEELLEPTEQRADSAYLIGSHQHFDSNCIPPGEYTLTQSYQLQKLDTANAEEADSSDAYSLDWTVVLDIIE